MAVVGEVLADRAQRERSTLTAYVGMVAFLASWAMLFAGLLFAYGLARTRMSDWPPPSVPELPLGLPTLNTAVIAASSAVLWWALRSARRGRAALLPVALAATLALGGAFLALQVVVWVDMWNAGLLPSSGQYGSLFYALTWVHAAHVGIGLLALAWLTMRAFAGAYSPDRHLSVRLWSHYWHFVGVVWLVLFLLVYVL
jgi:heme/copper-type cytochrome/quinol oxidase subunit 3